MISANCQGCNVYSRRNVLPHLDTFNVGYYPVFQLITSEFVEIQVEKKYSQPQDKC